MSGLTKLDDIVRSMRPEVVPGRFVFTTTDAQLPARATVVEDEGTTLVLEEETAVAHGLDFDAVFGWITLRVHSSLESVGLTATVSVALAAAGISCNVIAGRFHDHLLVPVDRVQEAVEVLERLAG